MSEIQNTQEIHDSCSYDKVIYDKLPHKQGNLRLLETIGDLYGVEPVDTANCRVLELGTATGKTIIPQAEEFPDSRFLGIDLSPTQIETGKEFIRSLNLRNIELRAANIMEVDASWGKFDYIISHGVYSWVPQAVQEKMLEICQTNLSPNGLAMISYNTYPGWHFKECARNLMLLHSKRANEFFDAKTEIQQARAFLDFTAEVVARQSPSYFTQFLEAMREHIKSVDDHYLFHEYLESENAPCYFLEFCRRLQEKGLQHVSDFDWTNYQTWQKDPLLRCLIEKTQDNIVSEQYVDFIVNRTFRSSVICHSDIEIRLRDDLVNRYHFFVPNDCVITLVESNGVMPEWHFSRSGTMEVSLPRSPLMDSVCEYLNGNRSGFFTFQNIWDAIFPQLEPHLLAGKVCRDDLTKVFDQLVRLEF
ncbi:MAG: class I SAM-dependent methyltransferase, partial [Planctomycetaceae bacterium]|nr:class I SAM-dependent methyltransferase [Planctomycetaceae bacterium]